MAKNQTTEKFIVSTHKLNIRDKPSMKGKVVDDAPVLEGEELTAYIGSDIEADGYVWVKVDFKGKKRWVVKNYLSPLSQNEEKNNNEE